MLKPEIKPLWAFFWDLPQPTFILVIIERLLNLGSQNYIFLNLLMFKLPIFYKSNGVDELESILTKFQWIWNRGLFTHPRSSFPDKSKVGWPKNVVNLVWSTGVKGKDKNLGSQNYIFLNLLRFKLPIFYKSNGVDELESILTKFQWIWNRGLFTHPRSSFPDKSKVGWPKNVVNLVWSTGVKGKDKNLGSQNYIFLNLLRFKLPIFYKSNSLERSEPEKRLKVVEDGSKCFMQKIKPSARLQWRYQSCN